MLYIFANIVFKIKANKNGEMCILEAINPKQLNRFFWNFTDFKIDFINKKMWYDCQQNNSPSKSQRIKS